MRPEGEIELSVVLPAYDAGAVIHSTLAHLTTQLERAVGPRCEIIVVDDGSGDRTAALTRSVADVYGIVRLVSLGRNQGKGAAVRRGVLESRGRYVVITDSDLPFGVSSVMECYRRLSDGAGVVYGDRYLPESRYATRIPALRRLGSRLNRGLVRSFLLRSRLDTQCGLKGLRGEDARRHFARLGSRGYAFDVELTARLLREGAAVTLMPVSLHTSVGGGWSMLRAELRFLRELWRIYAWMRVEPRREPDPVRPSPLRSVHGLLTTGWQRSVRFSQRHREIFVYLGIALMVAAAAHRLENEFGRLLLEPGPTGGSDLRRYHEIIHRWFAGEAVYGELRTAVHAPATYALMWPLIGPFDFGVARWVWGGLYVASMVWLIRLVISETGAATRSERVFLGLLPLAAYATAATVGNGQLILLVLPPLLTGILLLHRRDGLGADVAGAGLVLLTLASPTVAAPFFWAVLFLPGRIRPAALAVGGYAVLTLVGAAFQDQAALPLLGEWMDAASAGVARGAGSGGYANLASWLGTAGLGDWSTVASLLLLSGLGVWTFRHRRSDPWLVLGVSAVAARIWTYHRLYDDLLILVAMVAVYRGVRGRWGGPALSTGARQIGAAALLMAWVGALAPARLLVADPPWDWLMMGGETVAWCSLLGFLLWGAEVAPRRPGAPPFSVAPAYVPSADPPERGARGRKRTGRPGPGTATTTG